MAVILADDILKCIFLNENYRIPIRISLKFVPRSPIDDTPALAQVMADLAPNRQAIITLRPRQDGRYFADDVLKCIFLNENVWISLKIPPKFVPRSPINNIRALVQIMAWRRPGDKPLAEPMLVFVPKHICVTRSGVAPCTQIRSCVHVVSEVQLG